jgi:hypothetical protein
MRDIRLNCKTEKVVEICKKTVSGCAIAREVGASLRITLSQRIKLDCFSNVRLYLFFDSEYLR